MRIGLKFLFLLVFLGALVAWYLANNVYVPPPKDRPDSRFEKVDGVETLGSYFHLDADTNDRLYFRYAKYSNSGVELERVVDGQTKWQVLLGEIVAPHSQYIQQVNVTRSNSGEILVALKGSAGCYEEPVRITDGESLGRIQHYLVEKLNGNQVMSIGRVHSFKNFHLTRANGGHFEFYQELALFNEVWNGPKLTNQTKICDSIKQNGAELNYRFQLDDGLKMNHKAFYGRFEGKAYLNIELVGTAGGSRRLLACESLFSSERLAEFQKFIEGE